MRQKTKESKPSVHQKLLTVPITGTASGIGGILADSWSIKTTIARRMTTSGFNFRGLYTSQ